MFRFCLLLSFFVTTVASAQPFRIGIEGGLHAISLDYAHPRDEWSGAFRPAGSAMISAVVPVIQRFSVQTGLRYARLGNRINFDYTLVTDDPSTEPIHDVGWFTYTQNYLSIPIRLRYDVLGPVYLFVGPEVGYLLSARTRLTSSYPENRVREQSITDEMERLNVSATAGLGSTFRLLGQDFYTQAMYGRGLTPVGKKGNFLSSWHTQELGLTLGFLF
ncbi:MAG TPA: porin family protein [Rhodothermales bacterium]|nr:porin family protein [Rhodothermales bacterium]